MSRALRRGLALLTGCAVAVAGVAGCTSGATASQLRQVTEKVFSFEPGGELTIQSQNGSVTIEAWDRPEARIQITREVRAGSSEQAASLMKELRADVTIEKDRIAIKSEYPKRSETVGFLELFGQHVSALNIHYYVQVPSRTDLHLATSNGEVHVRGMVGEVAAKTLNGSIDVMSVAGPVRVSTTNGSIRVLGIDGSAKAVTTNGTVTAELRKSDGGPVELSTTNGDVMLMLPPEIRATVDAVTTNGRVSVGYPLQRGEGSRGYRLVQGTIAGGGTPLVLRTTNGNIVIRKLGTAEGT
jgi:DUF4097 and DUF4098 domain-containing protein YvlB